MSRFKPWLPVFLLSSTILSCGSDPAPSPEPNPPSPDELDLAFGSDTTFDIITWNIEEFPKDETETPTYLARVLEALEPDVVAIQEVWSPQHLQWVAGAAGSYELAIASNDPESGLAFLVNTETVEILAPPQAIYVNQSYDFGYRGPAVLRVRYRERDLTLINLHYKCCGDNILGEDWWDEEYRRLQATSLLKSYLDESQANHAVIAVGDWNDELTDAEPNNVFWPLIEDAARYRFADMPLAESNDTRNWSFPWYPSHIDHVLINEPLFEASEHPDAHIETILVEDALPNGEWDYYEYLSDHRPIGLRLPL